MAGVTPWENNVPPLPAPPAPPPGNQLEGGEEGGESNSKPIQAENEKAETLPAGIKELKSVLLGCQCFAIFSIYIYICN